MTRKKVADQGQNGHQNYKRPGNLDSPKFQGKLALQMNVSNKTMSRALKLFLGLVALKRGHHHLLTIRQIHNRLVRSRALIKRYALDKWKNILCTDEEIFTVEAK